MKRVAVVVLSVFVLASCSLGEREDWVEWIRGGFETGAQSGGASVRQSLAIEVIETNIRQRPRPLLARAEGVVDFANRRAQISGTTPRKLEIRFDDLETYATRSIGSVEKGDPRWARFDYMREPSEDVDDNDRRLAVGAGLISPALAVELLDGVLTGSIERIGTGTKAGVETTRYSGRLAPDAAVNEVSDEDRQEGITRMFETIGVTQQDFPVDVWLDAEQRVRGIRFVMRQQKDRVNAFTYTASWEFRDYGVVDAVALPARGDVIRSLRYRDFVTELIREQV